MSALYFSGAHWALGSMSRGNGLIYMLHRVKPAATGSFQPHAFLEVTPQFLDAVIVATHAAGIEFVSLDEAHRRLTEGDLERRFAVVTLDDGYRDNRVHALPVFRRHDVPFTIYASSGIADASCELWWIALERIIAATDCLAVDTEGLSARFDTSTLAGKTAAFRRLNRWLASELDEAAQRRAIRWLAQSADLDLSAMCRELAMDWDELREMAREPLAEIGAHTLGHHAVARLDADEARRQMAQDADRLHQELGRRPVHFAYPYGSPAAAGPRDFALARELGFKTAVTTRPGQLFAEHRDHLTALPRVSLNGLYQRQRYAEVLREGVPFALLNRFRPLNVA